ncbi:MAG: WbqC family protein [Bacteroidales bacterium]|nr:WbqC family protein [Bacteroidales bacterium]
MNNETSPIVDNCDPVLNSQLSILNLPTAYAPNIEYISAIARSEGFSIDVSEPYVRQTLRNRCEILTSQGVQKLSIPIAKKTSQSGVIKDTKIDYAENWQRRHWRSIQGSYNNSPYFLYYQDELKVFYEKRYDFLVDFNSEILAFILKKIQIKTVVSSEGKHSRNTPLKQENPSTSLGITTPYQQVFTNNKFVPNLSSFDLLFNCGPESRAYFFK